MWPYNDDEAGWLDPRNWAERPSRHSANDNDPARARRNPPAVSPAPKPTGIREVPQLE